jgi:hypothetical protein
MAHRVVSTGWKPRVFPSVALCCLDVGLVTTRLQSKDLPPPTDVNRLLPSSFF